MSETKVISKEKALELAPDYVSYIEGNFDSFDTVWERFKKIKKGDKVLTFREGKFIEAKVSVASYNDIRTLDGPFVRVSDGEYSWRVDGNRYCFPIG